MTMKWNQSKQVVGEALGGELLLVDTATRASWRLNATASFLWQHCNGMTEISDLARLEKAFHAALNAPEASFITHAPGHWFRIELHLSVQRLQLRTNATSIWAALTAGELPPSPERLDEPQELLVWRQGAASRFRMLGRDEAAALDAAARGEAIEMAQASENFLRGWLEAEIISAVRGGDADSLL